MATTTKTLTHQPQTPHLNSLGIAITCYLRSLNPKCPNSSRVDPSPLNQFSPFLHPQLVIDVIKKQSNPYHGLYFFNWASNPSPNPNNYSHNHHCYVAITDLLLSHSLFSVASSLLENANKLSDLMASKFITAYGNHKHVKGAIFWFHKAKSAGNGNILFSYNAILNVLVNRNQMNLAQSIFDDLMSNATVKPDVSSYCTMLKGCCKVGNVEKARKMFDKISEPNLICYNTMINGYCKKGDMFGAMRIFNGLLANKYCSPDTVTYTTLIDGYCKIGELNEARKWMNEMKLRCCKPNLLTYNAMIYGLCLKGNVDEAKKLMTEMRLNGVKENIATHLSILKGFCYAGKSVEAINYFEEIIRKGMKPDVKAYAIIVNEYCKMRKPNEAIDLLKEMRAKGIKPDVSSFNTVLRILIELGKLDTTIFLLKGMQKMGCKPNFVSYNVVICDLCKAQGRMQNVKELLHNMLSDGIPIGATTYSSLLKGYCEDGDEEMAKQTWNGAIDNNYVIDTESFLAFVSMLCEKGKPVEVEIMLKEMCKRCSVVDADIYWKILDEQLVMHFGGESRYHTKSR